MRATSSSKVSTLIRLLLLLVTGLLIGSIHGHSASAIAVGKPNVSHKSLFARSCPTVQSIGDQLKANGAGDDTVFYTKPAASFQADAFARSLQPPGKYWGNIVDLNMWDIWLEQCQFDGSQQDKIAPRCSEALAAVATGTAYVMIGPSEDITGARPNGRRSTWGANEFPTLMRNEKIAKIVRVDPDNVANQITVWTQGDPITLDASVT